MNIITNIKPLLATILTVIIFVSAGRCLWERKITEGICVLGFGCLLLAVAGTPEDLKVIGTVATTFLKQVGGSINGG